MPFSTFDLVAMAAIFAVALAGGLITIRMAQHRGRRFFRLANAFAAGLFLGIGFLHMLPESAEMLDGLVDYPLAALLALLGLVTLLSVDRIAFAGLSQTPQSVSPRPWFLLAALSVHSLIVGVALGLEPGIVGSLALFSAILFHKASDVFALIVNAHAEGVAVDRQKAMLVFFSLVTPAGIAIGSAATDGAAAAVAAGSVGAFAAGTIIYVAIVVIADRESGRRDAAAPSTGSKDLWASVGLIFAGVALTAALVVADVHGHGDGHAHGRGGGHGPHAVDSAYDGDRAGREEPPAPTSRQPLP